MTTRAQKRALAQHQNDLRAILASAEGQRFLYWLLELCGTLAANPALNGPAEGRRQIGLALIQSITDIDPFAYPKLLSAGVKRAADLREAAKEVVEETAYSEEDATHA